MSARSESLPGAPATIALAAITFAVALLPALQRLLVLDRDAVARGQLWRVATGSLVHFSASHLLLDVLTVCIAGALLERRGWALAPIVVASATAIGAAVLLLAPQLTRYGGLSGVAFTLIVVYTLDCLTAPQPMRTIAVIALALTAAKLGWELWSGSFVFVGDAGDAFQPVPLAHLVGAGIGVAAYFVTRLRSERHGAQPLPVSARLLA